MGILDDFDPDDKKAFQYGLLQAGLGILANNGRTPYGTAGQAIGAGLQQGLGAGIDYQQNMLTNKLRKQQLDQQSQLQAAQMKRYEAESAKDAAELAQTQNLRTRMGEIATGKSIDPISQVEISRYSPPGAEQAMQNGGQQPVPIGQKPFGISPQEALELYGLGADPTKIAAIAGMGKPEAFSLSPGQVRFENGQQIAAVPQEQKPLEIERMLDAAGITDPQQRANYMQQAIAKQTTHAPAMTIQNYPNPIPVINSKGEEVMAQFGNKGAVREVPYKPPAEKMGESQVKQLGGVQNTRNAIKEYRNALASFKATDIGNPDARAKMGTYYQNMMLHAKEAYNLGVLAKEDLVVLSETIINPLSFKGAFTSKKALDGQAVALDKLMAGMGETTASINKKSKMPAAASSENNSDGWTEEKPPAAQNKGLELVDQHGNRWKSDGMIWKPQ